MSGAEALETKTKQKKTAVWQPLAIAFALWFLVLIYAPFELYLTNQLEFWFTAGQLTPYALALFGVAFAVTALVLWLTKRAGGKLYPILAAACLIAFLCTWIQGSYLVFHLPPMNGAPVDWGAFLLDRACSIGLWVVITAVVFFLTIKLGTVRFEKVAVLCSLAVTLMLAATLATLFFTTDSAEKRRDQVATDEGMFTYSEDQNFLILVLDAVDGVAFEQSLARSPAYAEVFEDFTYFSNTTGGYPYSKCSIPLIVTGAWYEAREDFVSFETAAFEQSPFLQEVTERGYRKWIYPYDGSVTASVKAGEFENLTLDQPRFASFGFPCKLIIKMALVKHAPWDLKRFGYDLPGRLNEGIAFDGDAAYYDWSDLRFYQRLEAENPIELVSEKCYKYLHLEGAHEPHVYDPELHVLETSPYRDVIEANFKMVGLFLERMKEAGVYDNTVILIMSDHGSHNGMDLDTINQHPILLIKGLNEHHAYQRDDAPISYDDLQQAYFKLADGAQSEEVFSWREGDERDRRFLFYEMTNSDRIVEYIQSGHAEDMETLRPSGVVYTREK